MSPRIPHIPPIRFRKLINHSYMETTDEHAETKKVPTLNYLHYNKDPIR